MFRVLGSSDCSKICDIWRGLYVCIYSNTTLLVGLSFSYIKIVRRLPFIKTKLMSLIKLIKDYYLRTNFMSFNVIKRGSCLGFTLWEKLD